VGHAAGMGEMRTACKLLVGNPEGKKLVGRPRHRWVNNIRMNLRWKVVDWIHLFQDRDQCWALVNTVKAGNLLTG